MGEATNKINNEAESTSAESTASEDTEQLRAEIEDKLWTKVGAAIAKACADADKPRLRNRGPLMIEAGSPLAAKDTAPAQD